MEDNNRKINLPDKEVTKTKDLQFIIDSFQVI